MKTVVLLFMLAFFSLSCTCAEAASDTDKGKEAFEMNGCSGCHKIGKDWNGPDLTSVTSYRSKEWIIDYILHIKKYYDDPIVREMIKRFNLYMPEQGVEREDAELIYDYLKSIWEKTVNEKKKK